MYLKKKFPWLIDFPRPCFALIFASKSWFCYKKYKNNVNKHHKTHANELFYDCDHENMCYSKE